MQTPSVTAVQQLAKRKGKKSPSTLPGLQHSKRASSLTPPGFLFVFVTLFLALGAINGQNNLLFWLFGFSIAALIVSGVITGTAIIAVRLTAHPLSDTELGSPLKPRYTLHNTSKLLPNFALEVIELDAPTPHLPESTPAIAPHIRPKSHTTVQAHLLPNQRGQLQLNTIRVRTRFPFGLFTKSIDFSAPRQAIILPQPLQINQSTIERITATEDSSSRSISKRGAGLDYFAVRQYQPGDPLRTIAWKQSARADSLLVTEYPEPATDQRTLLLQPPPQATDDLEFETAISLAYTILKHAPPHARTALSIPWASISIPPGAGQAHAQRCSRALALLERSDTPIRSQHQPRRHPPIRIGYAHSTDPHPSDLYSSDFLPPQPSP